MTRPLRVEFAGALYHVTSRGDRREAIYEDDADRELFLKNLGEVTKTFNWVCHAYCLMSNHYHLVIETLDGNLAKGMRQLNGVYTQATNRRHGRVGHLFQGRYKAILVDGDAYLLELARYVVLNPVHADMVERPEDWRWSSYRDMLGERRPPDWLDTDALLAQFSPERMEAIQGYAQFVAAGRGAESIWNNLKRQIYLGDERFVERMQATCEGLSKRLGVPKTQQRPPAPPIDELASNYRNRNDAITAIYATGEYSYQQIADFFGLHFTTVGKIVRKERASLASKKVSNI